MQLNWLHSEVPSCICLPRDAGRLHEPRDVVLVLKIVIRICSPFFAGYAVTQPSTCCPWWSSRTQSILQACLQPRHPTKKRRRALLIRSSFGCRSGIFPVVVGVRPTIRGWQTPLLEKECKTGSRAQCMTLSAIVRVPATTLFRLRLVRLSCPFPSLTPSQLLTLAAWPLFRKVDFENVNLKPPSSALLESQVRSLFTRIAPLHVYQYFLAIHSTPHVMNIRPASAGQACRGNYTYASVLNSLDIRAYEFVLPAATTTAEQDQVVSLSVVPSLGSYSLSRSSRSSEQLTLIYPLRLQIGELGVYTLGAVVNAYTLISQQSRGQTTTDVVRNLQHAEVFRESVLSEGGLPDLKWLRQRLQQLPSTTLTNASPQDGPARGPNSQRPRQQLYGTFEHPETRCARELRDAWNNLRNQLQRYRSLANGKLRHGMDKLCRKQGRFI